ncbi:hypothetical protein Hanom_Chr01g00001891 [Helianthus anomalus]
MFGTSCILRMLAACTWQNCESFCFVFSNNGCKHLIDLSSSNVIISGKPHIQEPFVVTEIQIDLITSYPYTNHRIIYKL